MDSVKNYPNLIKQALTGYVFLISKFSHPNYEIVLIFDDEHHQYLVRKLGWNKNHRIRHIVLHVALKNGKIWIEEDMTEEGIATYFLENGVSEQDIVLGFQPPEMRRYTEFATA